MAKIKAIIDYVKLDAAVEEIQEAIRVVADVRPRIRAFVDHVEIKAMIQEAPFIVTWSIWDSGATDWDVVDGVPQTQWDVEIT